MTPADQKAALEKILRKIDQAAEAMDRAREHVLDLLGEIDRAELGEQPDAITALMETDGLDFISAVERLAERRGQP
jgi:hypothetical protein